MKNIINKKIYILKVIGIVALGYLLINLLIIQPRNNKRDTRVECNKFAIEFMQGQSKRPGSYNYVEREKDYDFFYQYCFRSRGYERL